MKITLFVLVVAIMPLAGCASDNTTQPATSSTTPSNPYPGPYTQNPFYPQEGPTH